MRTRAQPATFSYDDPGRRVQRLVATFPGTYPDGPRNPTEVRQFVWDGWRMWAVLDCPAGDCGAGASALQKCARGLELEDRMGALPNSGEQRCDDICTRLGHAADAHRWFSS